MNKALEELKERGFYAQCTDPDRLSARMDAGPITFYVGCDPTGPSLHIGHTGSVFCTPASPRKRKRGYRPCRRRHRAYR